MIVISRVSILVVMDLALQRLKESFEAWKTEGFNPCCNGFSVATPSLRIPAVASPQGFNPCCNGFSVATCCIIYSGALMRRVSILVVMDLALQPELVTRGYLSARLFQSLL